MRRFFILSLCSLIVAGCTDKVPTGLIRTSLTAYNEDESTKTSLGQANSIVWNEGEYISVFDGKNNCPFVLTSGAGSNRAIFSGEVSSDACELFAISPACESCELTGSTVNSLNLPASQFATEGGYDPGAALMVTRTTDLETLRFHHISSFLKLTPGFNCSSITVFSEDDIPLAGTFTVNVAGDGKVQSVSSITEGSTEVSIEGTITAGKTYLIGILPGVHTSGFSIRLTTSDGTKYIRKKNGAVSFSSGKILNLGTLSKEGPWTSIVSDVESVTLSRKAVGIVSGNDYQLEAVLSPAGIPSSALEWTSSDSSVATVSNGKVKGIKAGSCTVTASIGGKSASCLITVIASPDVTYRHGYTELNATEKGRYDFMLKRLFEFEYKVKSGESYSRVPLEFDGYVNFYDIVQLTFMIYTDYPEAFILSSSIPGNDYSTGEVYLRVLSTYTEEKFAQEMAEVYSECSTIRASIPDNATDYQKALSVHDTFLNSVHYGDMYGWAGGNIIGGLVNHRAVCEGYSRSYLFLCQQVGLKSIYIGGALQTSSTEDTWSNHAWNHVMIGNSWFLVDTTVDGGLVGGTVGYRNFLLGKTNALQIHRYTDIYGSDQNTGANRYRSLPALSDTDYPKSF